MRPCDYPMKLFHPLFLISCVRDLTSLLIYQIFFNRKLVLLRSVYSWTSSHCSFKSTALCNFCWTPPFSRLYLTSSQLLFLLLVNWSLWKCLSYPWLFSYRLLTFYLSLAVKSTWNYILTLFLLFISLIKSFIFSSLC